MPVSKKRKKAITTQRRVLQAPAKSERWAVTLNGSRLMYIRNDPDFLTIIKVGRVMNAISYAMTDVASYEPLGTVLGTRQYRRAMFVLGGYLHEGIKLIQSIKGRYLTEPSFEPLRALALGSEDKKTRDYLKKVRNVAAFHLDEFDEITRHMLKDLKPKTYPFTAGDNKTEGTFYFEFSDYIDLAFLVETFADGRSWEETSKDMIKSITNIAYRFLMACHDFLIFLCKKIGIAEHVYR